MLAEGPPGAEARSPRHSFASWARENPQYSQEPALDGLFRWARTTYPCPQETAAPARTRPTR